MTRKTRRSTIVCTDTSQSRIDLGYEMLRPLKQGKPAVLKVDDPEGFKKSRVKGQPLLFLTPESMYAGISPRLIVSYEAHGCEIIDTREPIKMIHLYRVGLSYTVARRLAKVLNQVFAKEKEDGKR